MLERHKHSSTGAVPYVPCTKANHVRGTHDSFHRLCHCFCFAILPHAGCPCNIPFLRCGVLPYKASLRTPSSRPLNNRFKAPSGKSRVVQQANGSSDAPFRGSFDHTYCAVHLERCAIHQRFHPSRSHDQHLVAPRIYAFRRHRRNRLAAEPRAQPVRLAPGRFLQLRCSVSFPFPLAANSTCGSF